MKRLSVIILTYNSEKDIYECLDSVYKYNDIGDNLEIIVVDNQSHKYKAMQMRLAQDYPQVRVVQNTHNGGYGQGNNVGIRLAESPIVAVMNPDVRLLMPTFGEMLRCFNDPQVIMCGGKQILSSGQQGWSVVCSYKMPPILRLVIRNIALRTNHYNHRYMYFAGAFFLVRKEYFEQIGMFDENLFMYSEEPDIHIRMRKQFPNGKMCYFPNIHYLHKADTREFSPQRYRVQLTGDTYVFKKHHISFLPHMRVNILLTYIFQLRAVLRHNAAEATVFKQQRNIIREFLSKK